MANIQKLKLGNTSPDSLMLGNVKVEVKGDSMFDGFDNKFDNYFHHSEGFYVQGLLLLPYYKGNGWNAPNIYMWPWDLVNPNQTDAYKDVLHAYNYYGYHQDEINKNITKGLKSNIPNPGAPNWGWSSNSDWGIAVTLWSKESNKTIEGVEYTDFGESPIVIKLLDNRFDNLLFTGYDENDVIISQDKRTITIKRVRFDTHIALTIYDENDQTLSRVNTLLKDVIVNLSGMRFHNRTFRVEYPDSTEGYDIYLGDKLVWRKERTLENCWKKYGIAISTNHPSGFLMQNAECSTKSVIHPLKSAIKSNLQLNSSKSSSGANYIFMSVPNITVKINNAVAGTKLTLNLVVDKGSPSRQSSWFDNSFTLTGTDGQLSFQREDSLQINKASGDNTIEWHYEMAVEFPQESALTDYAVVEIISTSSLYTISAQNWPTYSQFGILLIKDYTGNVKINTNVYNVDFWNDIKQWYATNVYNDECFKSGALFNSSNISGEITLNLPPGDDYLYGADNFEYTLLEKITFVKSDENSHYSSPYKMFHNAQSLNLIDITWADGESDGRYLCGATNTEAMFAACTKLQTYPNQLIKWNAYRSNSWIYTIGCSMCAYMFEYSGIVTIPEYSNVEDENTILCANRVDQMFNDCKSLVTIGPILDMCIVLPNNAKLMFYNCNNLVSVKIKNLNHGDWDFANYSANAIGNFENLNLDSIVYLIENLADLNNHIEGYDYNANQNISFLSWQSDYTAASSSTPNWDYTMMSATQFACRRRYSDVNDAVCIAKTTFRSDINIPSFTVTDLKSTDSLYLIYNNGESMDHITGGSPSIEITIPQGVTSVEFRLVGNESDRDIATIILDGGLDWRIPRVSNAILYLPDSCKSKLTEAGIYDSSKWTSKGWTIKNENGETWPE